MPRCRPVSGIRRPKGPKTVAYRRHNGGSNYVFADGHARWLRFEQTFQQQVGLTPEVDLYDPGPR